MIAHLDIPTPWQLLALSAEQLERADLVVMNLSVARGVPGLECLDVAKYVGIVNEWTEQFRLQLPGMERKFKETPWNWKNDIRFFRVGMLQGFLGHVIGIRYIEDHKHAKEIYYTDPRQLFLHGVLESKQGTCANMATLHVAMARRMGWPVTLAAAGSHTLSRFDDGQVIHNIEATSTHPGSFNSEPDQFYIEKYKLPGRAIECGSDLNKLTARQMLAIFLSFRGRHYWDTNRIKLAELDLLLARVLFPQFRSAYVAQMIPYLKRGAELFDSDEVGHPEMLFQGLAPVFAPNFWRSLNSGITPATGEAIKTVQHCDVHSSGLPTKVGQFTLKEEVQQ